ncbi:hypothetical protein EDB92DRAFT_1816660 [Lactarius akahatsu]|uniref:Uncharacterized protein n=1 Tax=Lactarius akahatsu TaxID=416441 RepID=A0AAD4Q7T3_9AGAM|nr:hypothetical protein EDB92DRAFT_1816660 [Lactarius akahatsu]
MPDRVRWIACCALQLSAALRRTSAIHLMEEAVQFGAHLLPSRVRLGKFNQDSRKMDSGRASAPSWHAADGRWPNRGAKDSTSKMRESSMESKVKCCTLSVRVVGVRGVEIDRATGNRRESAATYKAQVSKGQGHKRREKQGLVSKRSGFQDIRQVVRLRRGIERCIALSPRYWCRVSTFLAPIFPPSKLGLLTKQSCPQAKYCNKTLTKVAAKMMERSNAMRGVNCCGKLGGGNRRETHYKKDLWYTTDCAAAGARIPDRFICRVCLHHGLIHGLSLHHTAGTRVHQPNSNPKE